MTRPSFLVLLLVASSEAFSPELISHASHQPSTALKLLPNEGSLLEAASRTAYNSEKQSPKTTPEGATTHTSKAHAFAARVFSLPSSLRHPHQEEAETADGLLYPIVGFCYVRGQTKPLPTTSNPSCRLLSRDEELYGWFRVPAAASSTTVKP